MGIHLKVFILCLLVVVGGSVVGAVLVVVGIVSVVLVVNGVVSVTLVFSVVEVSVEPSVNDSATRTLTVVTLMFISHLQPATVEQIKLQNSEDNILKQQC